MPAKTVGTWQKAIACILLEDFYRVPGATQWFTVSACIAVAGVIAKQSTLDRAGLAHECHVITGPVSSLTGIRSNASRRWYGDSEIVHLPRYGKP